MIRVLFVCLGNICRSPMAEALFRRKVAEAGLSDSISADSAGTGGWHIGKPPHHGTRNILERNGIDSTGLQARQVGREDFVRFHYMVAMDASNLEDLQLIGQQENKPRLLRLLDLNPELQIKNVPDPYYTGNFEEVYSLVDRGCDALLNYIIDYEGLSRPQ